MECNKEEAVRAKELAENKMQIKDFIVARKLALKAQKLYSDLDNISQMLSVCEVHCSAEQRIPGNDMNWYGILQIEQTADEALIKKQFRKFALLLHPDKNKFPGAEAAFKLIGEAQRVLLDQGRRSLYDMKIKSSAKQGIPTRQAHHASGKSNAGSRATKYPVNHNPQQGQPYQQGQASNPNGRPTFWTVCPHCSVKYQYFREVLNRQLRCQSCLNAFVALDISVQGATPIPNCSIPGQQTARGFVKVESQSINQNHVPSGGNNANTQSIPQTNLSSGLGRDIGCDKKMENGDGKCKSGKPHEVRQSANLNSSTSRKQVSDSSESCNTESCNTESCHTETSSDSEINFKMEENNNSGSVGSLERQNLRRSQRNKRNISYNENLGDEYSISSSKKAKGVSLSSSPNDLKDASNAGEALKVNGLGSSAATTGRIVNELAQEGTSVKGNLHGEMRKEKSIDNDILKGNVAVKGIVSDVSPESVEDNIFSNLPEPEFSNFEILDDLKVGQVWACYDAMDAMPRFYARIRRVFHSSQKVELNWLEAAPDNADEIAWDHEGLPISCGKFVLGHTDKAENRNTFSHLVCRLKGCKRGDTCVIYPRPGETWALYKNWDIKWKIDATDTKKFEYEFVEILSDYDEGSGVRVAHLAKIKGFSCLFCRTMKQGEHSFSIPPDHVLRFSHRVPSVRMTGDERADVPKGSFELDSASLPTNLEEIDLPDNSEPNTEMQNNGLFPEIQPDEAEPMESDLNLKKEGHIPDPDFHDFDADRSIEKFEIGQIWAFYSDEDGLPKYYGQIKAIYVDPVFKVDVVWLTSHSLPGNVSLWRNKGMPICCGNFKLKRGRAVASYDDTSAFSHQVRAATGDKNEFIVFPKTGEIWALYKQWNTDLTHEDIQNSEYEIVEIVKENGLLWKVKVFERVDGFVSVFKAQVRGSSQVVLDIPASQLLSFSHQIPAYKLTKERDGSLNGFWELDPASLPASYFSSD